MTSAKYVDAGLWPGVGISVGAGMGAALGVVLGGGPGIAVGAAMGAGLGVVAGAVAQAWGSERARTHDDHRSPGGRED